MRERDAVCTWRAADPDGLELPRPGERGGFERKVWHIRGVDETQPRARERVARYGRDVHAVEENVLEVLQARKVR